MTLAGQSLFSFKASFYAKWLGIVKIYYLCLKVTTRMIQSEEKLWYAMRATYGRNLSAKLVADSHNIDNYIPMHQVITRCRGKKQRKWVPVIRDLIFILASSEEIMRLKRQITYLQYITRPINKRNEPIVVPEEQMKQFIDITISENSDLIYLRPEEVNLQEGTKIKVHGGEFDGYEGYFVKLTGKRNKRIVVQIDSVIAVAVKISPDLIEVIKD